MSEQPGVNPTIVSMHGSDVHPFDGSPGDAGIVEVEGYAATGRPSATADAGTARRALSRPPGIAKVRRR